MLGGGGSRSRGGGDLAVWDIFLGSASVFILLGRTSEIKSPTVLPDNAYLSLGKRLHFRGPTLPVIAVATSEVGPAVLLVVEEVCQVLRFQTNSVPRYQ